MNRIRWALRWRLNLLHEVVQSFRIATRTFLFLIWYRDILGIVIGARGVQIRQRVRIVGPGRVYIGDRVKFGYDRSPSWRNGEIQIITKFRESVLSIGDESSINNNNAFVVVKKIDLKCRVHTGHDCQFYDSDLHSIDPIGRRSLGDKGGRQGDVVLETNSMIGAQVTIGPGTQIGENTVVGMRSHTRFKKFPENYVVFGNPARAVMNIDDLLQKTNPETVMVREMPSEKP